VGIYVFKGHVLELGPYMGAPRESLTSSQEPHSKLVVLIQDSSGRILGQLEIDSHTANAFGAAEEQAVRQIAKELGERWPEARS
jgi:putative methionine-R-sulfoxide reductase with GAF domain